MNDKRPIAKEILEDELLEAMAFLYFWMEELFLNKEPREDCRHKEFVFNSSLSNYDRWSR